MVEIKIGNILDCKEDIIIHQVNIQGIMGGGVARQLSDRYKELEKEYKQYCSNYDNNYDKLKATVLFVSTENKIIGNIFSQKPNFDTEYEAIKKCLTKIKEYAKSKNKTVCMPYKIGCGIANGEWNIVYKIIEEVFSDYGVTLYKLEEKNENRRANT